MVNVRIMRMAVHHRRVPMGVGVRFSRRIARAMFVLMMGVVRVAVTVEHFLVFVLMLVPFGQVKPYSCGHQESRNNQRACRRFA